MPSLIVCGNCGGLAFTYYGSTEFGAPILASLARLPDGSHPDPGTWVKCGTCQEELRAFKVLPAEDETGQAETETDREGADKRLDE